VEENGKSEKGNACETYTLDIFSDVLWTLSLANSMLPLVDKALKAAEKTQEIKQLWIFAVLSVLVFITILREYTVNRYLLTGFGEVYEEMGREPVNNKYYSSSWFLNIYILFHFLLGVFQYIPVYGSFTLFLIGLIGYWFIRNDICYIECVHKRMGSEKPKHNECKELLCLYKFWGKFDLLWALVAFSLFIFFLFSSGNNINRLLIIIIFLAVFNFIDFMRNKEFYFENREVYRGKIADGKTKFLSKSRANEKNQ
jgi:hypothetical protein